jgi:branched-subunit amino acid aminotransferase/4-amino-4-deoxychorismate lyase
MSENVTNELLYETLKQIQGKLSDHDQNFNRLENELRALKTHLVALVQTDLNRDGDLAPLMVRIERIERRLEING